MHPDKSKVVYCKDSNRTEQHPHVSFTFLGFTFRPRQAHSKHDQLFTSFLPGASDDALRRMRQEVRRWRLNRQTHVTLAEMARLYNPVIPGVVAILWRVLQDRHARHLPAHRSRA
jgi:RNA-directed DNA polymerase